MNKISRSCVFAAVAILACRSEGSRSAKREEPPHLVQPAQHAESADPKSTPAGQSRAEATKSGAPASWHGIGLRRVAGCERCCGLDFPRSFGASSADELELVKEIAGGEGRAEELDCHFPYAMQAFEHLRVLATEQQVRAAAVAVLQANGEEGIDLGGGELAEVFGAEFMAPVLERYAAVKELVNPKLEAHIATTVCSSAYGMAPGKRLDVERLIKVLASKGASSLASRMKAICAETARERAQ